MPICEHPATDTAVSARVDGHRDRQLTESRRVHLRAQPHLGRVRFDGDRLPAGEVHGWWHGQTETACGLALSRSELVRFGALRWRDVQPDSGGSADLVTEVCGRCASVLRPRGAHADGPGWTRSSPRP